LLKGQLIQRRFACWKSGHNPAEWVVTMFRNGWTVCSGMGGHNGAEWLDSFQRNEWSLCSGIRIYDAIVIPKRLIQPTQKAPRLI